MEVRPSGFARFARLADKLALGDFVASAYSEGAQMAIEAGPLSVVVDYHEVAVDAAGIATGEGHPAIARSANGLPRVHGDVDPGGWASVIRWEIQPSAGQTNGGRGVGVIVGVGLAVGVSVGVGVNAVATRTTARPP